MIISVFTIRDDKAQAYLQPFFLSNESMARRAIADCVSDSDHMFGKHPEDYALFSLGTFDDQSGKFVLTDAPRHLINLIDVE